MGDLPEDSVRILAFCSPSQASGGKVLCPTYDPHTVFSSDTRAHRHKRTKLETSPSEPKFTFSPHLEVPQIIQLHTRLAQLSLDCFGPRVRKMITETLENYSFLLGRTQGTTHSGPAILPPASPIPSKVGPEFHHHPAEIDLLFRGAICAEKKYEINLLNLRCG